MTVACVPESTDAEQHEAFTLLNDLTQGLGMAVFPYSRTGSGPRINVPALKEMLTYAVELLNSDAEEEAPEPVVVDFNGFAAASAGSWGNAYPSGASIPIPVLSQAQTQAYHKAFQNSLHGPAPSYPATTGVSVGPGNTKLVHSIAKYAGWSDDLLTGCKIALAAKEYTREQALDCIAIFIKQHGYNPANFDFSVTYYSTALMFEVHETVSGAHEMIMQQLVTLASPAATGISIPEKILDAKNAKDKEKAATKSKPWSRKKKDDPN